MKNMKEGWVVKKLGEVCDLMKNGANIKQEKGAGGYPISRIETLSGGVFNRDRLGYANIFSLEKYESYVLDSGDLLLSHINSKTYVGRIVVYNKVGDESIIHGMNLLRLKLKTAIITPPFMYYYSLTNSYKDQIANRRKDAVNQSSIATYDLKTVSIPIPPLSLQSRIVSELDGIHSIIEKKREQLKQLDALAQSIFYDMFGDPIQNEKGWEVKKLQHLFKVTSSKRILQSEWQSEGIPFYKVSDVVGLIRGYEVKPSTFILESQFSDLVESSLVPKENDLLITSRGTLGECYIIKNSDRFYFQDGMITWLSQIGEDVLPIFIKAIFSNNNFREYLISIANSSTIAYLSIKQLALLPIPLPPLSLQQTFAAKIEAIEKQKGLIKQSIAEVETLLASRMQFYFDA